MTDDRKRNTGGEVELLPLYDELQGHPKLEIIKHYARANVDRALAESRAEVERLRAAVAQNITDATMLRGMQVIDGGLNIGLEGGGARLLAEAFAEQFIESGAVNFLEVKFTHERVGNLTVTMQKAGALTPADKARQAEARAERLAGALRGVIEELPDTHDCDCSDCAPFTNARAALNLEPNP